MSEYKICKRCIMDTTSDPNLYQIKKAFAIIVANMTKQLNFRKPKREIAKKH